MNENPFFRIFSCVLVMVGSVASSLSSLFVLTSDLYSSMRDSLNNNYKEFTVCINNLCPFHVLFFLVAFCFLFSIFCRCLDLTSSFSLFVVRTPCGR